MSALKAYIIIGAAVALVATLGASHRWAYNSGRTAERTAALERSIELIKERSKTNEEISGMDDAQLCAELGGSWLPDEARCE